MAIIPPLEETEKGERAAMKVVMDTQSYQVQAHLEREEVKGKRLKTFLELVGGLAPKVEIAYPAKPLTKEAFSGATLLVSTTRTAPTSAAEADAVYDFVAAGGRLLMMSNHQPNEVSDNAAVSRLGFVFEPTSFKTPDKMTLTYIANNLLSDHEIITGWDRKEPAVKVIVANSTGSVWHKTGRPLAYLSPTVLDRYKGQSVDGRVYAVAFNGARGDLGACKGKVIAHADSDILGEPGTTWPGRGILGEGDNLLFTKRMLQWLVR
ncbi:MAG: hypothetical protein FJ319_06140 [SAR202 cluster bacterium]|nr:hypothetical protein [SAR202 cluster bacterium]